ncbi:hypothetical protein [Chelatococcus reniformis]|uniref:hypothetical protein n=1 Tax=Chelatococcus reniformis TaxID=1494448 RepID=UPI001667D2FE|nr:hypothetical protein [Chelatococcus reniformis]
MALPSEPVVAHHPEIVAFCRVLSVAPRTHSVRHAECDYTVFCFSDAADAVRFRERWGGEPFDPRDKGKGNEWFKWRKGPSASRRD